MNETNVKSVGLKYGVLLGAAFVGTFFITYLLDLVGNQALGWLPFVLVIVFVFLALKAFKEGNEGFMSFGQGFKGGMLTTAVGAIINAIVSYIFLKFAGGDYFDKVIEVSRERMEENPGMTEEQVEQAMEFTTRFMTPEISAISGIVMIALMGLVVSLIISAILKKDVPEGI
ncbi:MAG: DUF4199 domain-containing protein [Bacteroidota bacterium]